MHLPRPLLAACFLVAAGAAALACSATTQPNQFAGGAGGVGPGGADVGGSAADGSSGVGIFDAGHSDGSGGGCAEETQFIYTLASDNALYKFDPPSLAFTLIGYVNCPTIFGPFSMAVDRVGRAWAVFQDGSLFSIDTKNAACTATSFLPGQNGFVTFGMGFSSNAVGSEDETLYVSDSGNGFGSTQGLAKIDLTTMTLTPIGGYDLLQARAEMTGTGDAKLFGAFEGSPYIVAQVDKTSAHIISQAPQSAINYPPNGSNFAFAAWGGDFWLFVGPGTSTDVFHYKPSDGSTVLAKSVGFAVVGAGVSTCAPTKPPS